MTTTIAANVTLSQINACTPRTDVTAGEKFYEVKSQTSTGVTYEVRYIRKGTYRGFTCTCAAGQNAKTCWHQRAAVQHASILKANAKKTATNVDAETLARVESIKPRKVDYTAKAPTSKPFSLMR